MNTDGERLIQERLAFGTVVLRPRAGPASAELTAAAFDVARSLRLPRAIVFLDFEATGIDAATDRIIEVFAARVEPDGAVSALSSLVDPGVAIPHASTRVHGIDGAQLQGAPTFAELAPALLRLLRHADLAGYNLARYDLPLLRAELERSGHGGALADGAVIDACALFKMMERRDLASAVRFYCGIEQAAGHTAAGDTLDTMRVLVGQLRRYPQLPRDVSELDSLLRPPAERQG